MSASLFATDQIGIGGHDHRKIAKLSTVGPEYTVVQVSSVGAMTSVQGRLTPKIESRVPKDATNGGDHVIDAVNKQGRHTGSLLVYDSYGNPSPEGAAQLKVSMQKTISGMPLGR